MKYLPTPPLLLYRRFVRSIEFNGFRGALAHSWQRLFRSLKNNGLSGTFERAFLKAPVAPAPQVASLPKTHPFDLLRGTDTGGFLSGASIPAATLSALYTTAYLGIAPSALRSALAALPLQREDFTFVDIGSGKGRALLVAAEFPFRDLIGVEIAAELCQIARANLALHPQWKDRISVVNQDATKFAYPGTPLVLFVYFPFLSPILRRVLANLLNQLRRSPHPAYLLYADIYGDLVRLHEDTPAYQKVISSFAEIREQSNSIYPLTPEETDAEPSSGTLIRFTLYSIDVTAGPNR
ncbi:MAG: hypothetical protein ABSF23_04070 [Terracidiphilus sp.]|jgi:SAM-dependent methyltransferase